ncbi:hypothetical protein OBE_14290, partial [human gut metagenome]
GKHGDEESLIAMKTVGKKPAIGEHKKELMALVKKAVLKIACLSEEGILWRVSFKTGLLVSYFPPDGRLGITPTQISSIVLYILGRAI